MNDAGLLQYKHYGDLRDLIARRFEDGRVISVGPDDSLLTAFQRMRLADVSQLPVLVDGKQLVGVLDESDVLLGLHQNAAHFSMTVGSAMTNALHRPRAWARSVRGNNAGRRPAGCRWRSHRECLRPAAVGGRGRSFLRR